jgi:hypothetical protein
MFVKNVEHKRLSGLDAAQIVVHGTALKKRCNQLPLPQRKQRLVVTVAMPVSKKMKYRL